MTATAKKTGLVYHGRFLDHLTGDGHPEQPARLQAIVNRFKAVGLWDQVRHLRFHEADVSWVETIHADSYVSRFRDTCIGATPRGRPWTPWIAASARKATRSPCSRWGGSSKRSTP